MEEHRPFPGLSGCNFSFDFHKEAFAARLWRTVNETGFYLAPVEQFELILEHWVGDGRWAWAGRLEGGDGARGLGEREAGLVHQRLGVGLEDVAWQLAHVDRLGLPLRANERHMIEIPPSPSLGQG